MTGRMWRLASSLLLLTQVACSDDGGTGPADAAPPDAPVDSAMIDPSAPAPPDIPWLEEGAPDIAPAAAPQLTPCPSGWTETELGEVTTCAPYPTSAPDSCAAFEAHFPGASGCARVGTACAADGWPGGLAASGVAYVRPGGSGDGSRAAPFGRIADALTSGATTIALAEGTYAEAVTLGAGVGLVGACAEGTRLTRAVRLEGDGASIANVSVEGATITSEAETTISDVTTDGSVRAAAGALTLARVAIRGEGLAATAGATVDGAELVIDGASGDAVYVAGDGSRVDLEDVGIFGAGGYGLQIVGGATARIERAAIVGSARANVSNAGGTGALVDVVLGGDGSAPTTREEQGIVQSDGELTLSRVVLTDSGWAGIDLWGGALGATDLVIHGTVPVAGDASSGYGITAVVGTLSLERAHVAENTSCGILTDVGEATLTDVTVVDTRESVATATGLSFGRGMQIAARTATLSRLRARGNVRAGISIIGEETNADLADVHISDTAGSMADGNGGECLFIADRATVHVERTLLERCEFAAIATREGGSLTATDLVCRDVTSPNNFGISGYGIRAEVGGIADVTRALIERISLAGIHVVDDGSAVTARDLVVRDMLGEETFGLHGWGLGATNGGQADLTRARISRPRYVGIVTNGPGSRLTAVDLVLEDTLEARCADELCADAPFGIGLGAYSGAAVDLSSFLITRSHVIGVQLAGEGMVDLANGEVSMSPVGANVQTDPFVIERLTEGVAYRENEQNLVTDALPVPTFGGVE